MTTVNWRTINIDALDPDSPANFDLKTLTPAVAPVSAADVQNLASQIRQLLRGGDSEGALRGALENAPYGGDERGKVDAPGTIRAHFGIGTLSPSTLVGSRFCRAKNRFLSDKRLTAVFVQ